MILGDVELHNTVETAPAPGGGHCLYRFPRAVRQALSPLGRMVAAESSGCEIRFVTESDSVRVDLAAIPGGVSADTSVTVFRGGFLHSVHRLTPGRVEPIMLADIGSETAHRFRQLDPAARDTGYFHHRVWRILCGRFTAVFHGVDACGYAVRPPVRDELPRKRLLCYGSSITHGASPNIHHLSYIYTTGRILRRDVWNQGLSGSCRLEPEVADYMADRDDWDDAILELGVNMRRDTSPEAFAERAGYLVETLIRRRPDNHLFLITIFPNSESPGVAGASGEIQANQCAFDDVLRNLHRRLGHPRLHLIEGARILTRADNLSPDLIHPSDFGHAEMGANLARFLEDPPG